MSLDHHGSYVHEFETARRREQVTDRLTAALGGLIESDKF